MTKRREEIAFEHGEYAQENEFAQLDIESYRKKLEALTRSRDQEAKIYEKKLEAMQAELRAIEMPYEDCLSHLVRLQSKREELEELNKK